MSNEEIRVVIADDEPGMRMIMRKMIEKAVGFTLCGEADNGPDLLKLVERGIRAQDIVTKESFENPLTPPGFCMLLRKHLTGGRLTGLHMEPGDRIVFFDFLCTNEMGDLVRNILCAELMGRYSNLVLVQNGKIIDALKRVDFEDSDVRQLLPGLRVGRPRLHEQLFQGPAQQVPEPRIDIPEGG